MSEDFTINVLELGEIQIDLAKKAIKNKKSGSKTALFVPGPKRSGSKAATVTSAAEEYLRTLEKDSVKIGEIADAIVSSLEFERKTVYSVLYANRNRLHGWWYDKKSKLLRKEDNNG